MSNAIQHFSITSPDLPRPMVADGAVTAPIVSSTCHPIDAPPPESIPDFPAPDVAASPSDDGRASQEGGSSGATPTAGSAMPVEPSALPVSITKLMEGAGQQPPDLPEVKACRRLLQAAHSVVINSMLTIDELQDKGQLARYQEDVRGLYGAASLLMYELHKAHGSRYMPPELPKLVEGA